MIVILAIIALIATPIVLNIINETKESANKTSIDMYGKAVEQAFMKESMSTNGTLYGEYISNEDGTVLTSVKNNEIKINVEYNGNKVVCDNIQIQDNNQIYLSKCKISGKETEYAYGELFLEEPNLYNNTLTPVVYDGDNWKVADASKRWYDYSKQEWANAVILKSDSDKKVGDTITVDAENPDALAMLVWIPRYEYKIEGTYGKGGTNTESPGEIEVNFVSTSKKQASEGYRIHPAFNFGGTEISGIWVGKFETGHTTKTTTPMYCESENCEEANNIRILPNKVSLRNNSVSSFFYGIRSMSMENNVFGINKDVTDTHMMKNSEWGAVAYLSQSKYGKYGNSDYEGREKETYINNSSGYYTGRSGGSYGGNTAIKDTYSELDLDTLDNSTGFYMYDGYLLDYNTNTKTTTRDMKKIASTTGNITGIYDMSGGAWEYVMGVFANSYGALWSGKSSTFNSGFKGKVGDDGTNIEGLEWPKEKYYEVYKASSGTTIDATTACNGEICYGHSLSEIINWYGDLSYFVFTGGPWFLRGGSYANSINAGVFGWYGHYGNPDGIGSTRIVFVQTT